MVPDLELEFIDEPSVSSKREQVRLKEINEDE